MSKIYRTILCEKMESLRDVSPQAERLYCRLALGRFSTRTGLIRYRERDLAIESRLRPGELIQFLAELADAGLIICASNAPAVYLVGFCATFAPLSPNTRGAWVAEVAAFKCTDLGPQTSANIELQLSTIPYTDHTQPPHRPRSENSDQRTVIREQEEAKASKSPSAPAPATPEQIKLALEAKKPESQTKPASAREKRDVSPTDQGVTRGKAEVVEKKAPPIGLALVAAWNELLPDNVSARLDKTNKRLLDGIVAKHGVDEIRTLLTKAQSDEYYSGNSPKFGALSIGAILSRENWEKFYKRMTQQPKQAASPNAPYYEVL